MKPILLDTGPIVALLDPTDELHHRCVDAIADTNGPLITCETVIAESCHLLRSVEGAVDSILHSVHSREFGMPIGLGDAANQVSRIMSKYRDSGIDLADAFLIHLANEFETGDILTVDSDFHFYRWGRNNTFRILVRLHKQ